MNIGLLTIATGKYDIYVKPLWECVRQHFCAGHNVTLFVHADKRFDDVKDGRYELRHIEQAHLGWPFATLYRYRVFSRSAEVLRAFDYLFYLDIDMKIVFPVGDELFGDLVAVRHPGFDKPVHDVFPHERRQKSEAFVPEVLRTAYYCGGIQGGSMPRYLRACQEMRDAIERDLDRGIIATWHDESHWNKYLVGHPPTKVLGSEYCVPEEFAHFWKPGPRILALKKNHAVMQT